MADRTVLFGNGINLAEGGEGYPNWNELLSRIANRLHVGRASHGTSQSLLFDLLAHRRGRRDGVAGVDEIIHEEMQRLDCIEPQADSLFHRLLDVDADAYLTTNYDYALERAICEREGIGRDGLDVGAGYANETYISLHRCRKYKGGIVYHVHGELNYPNSICLGYMHYVRNLSSVVGALTEESENGLDISLREDVLRGKGRRSWADRFFNSDVYIVGFGMAESEIDFWWLLDLRARIILAGGADAPRNTISYLCAYEGEAPEICETLESLKVDVYHQQVTRGEWKEAYETLIDDVIPR